jgi:hypothetical protein
MNYGKKEFGLRLKQQLTACYDVVRIARWAHQEFLDHCRDLEPGLQPEMMKVIAMEEGPEFEMSEQEIQTLANELLK